MSHHQNWINWQQAKAAGLGWVSAKVTEGHTYTDPDGGRNLDQAAAAGLTVCAYHFARPDPGLEVAHDAARQAGHYAAHRNVYKHGGPAVLDWEATNRKSVMLERCSATWQVAWIRHWADWWQAKGVPTVVYCDRTIARMVAHAARTEQVELPALWLAYWTAPARITPQDGPVPLSESYSVAGWKPTWWQWADQGTVAGIRGNVDLDLTVRDLSF